MHCHRNLRADRPADGFGLAQACGRRRVLLAFDEIGEAGEASAGGGELGEAVLGEAQESARSTSVVELGKEHALASIAALGHMIGQAGNDDAGETGHRAMLPDAEAAAKLNALSP